MASWVLPAPRRTTGEGAAVEAEPEVVVVATIGRAVMMTTTIGVQIAETTLTTRIQTTEITLIVTEHTTQDTTIRIRSTTRAT